MRTDLSLDTPSLGKGQGSSWAADACQWLRWFAEHRVGARLMDERRMVSPLVVLEFGNKGLMAMQVAPAYGGLGVSTQSALKVFEQLGAIDMTLATLIVNNNCLGIRTFERSAQPDKKAAILPALATGRELISFALSEPGAGSNPMAIESSAQRSDVGFRLNGRKMWIGNAAWANHLNVFCKLSDARGLDSALTAFVVHTEAEGIEMGPELMTMGMRGMVQNLITFENVAASDADMLGRPGEGMSIANDAMMHTRVAFGAAFLGGMRRCVQLAARYAARRRVGTGLLADNPVTLHRLAEANAKIELIDALLEITSDALDSGQPLSEDFFVVCKVAASEFFWQVADSAVQLCGGRGYLENNVLARFLRDARVGRIYEGPSETLLHYLGMRVLKGSPLLTRALKELCDAPELASLLDEVVQHVKENRVQLAPQIEDDAREHWLAYKVGRVASWVILLAAHRRRARRKPDERGVSAWTNAQLDRVMSEVLETAERREYLLPARELFGAVEAYAHHIGQVQESLPGEDQLVDPLLRV